MYSKQLDDDLFVVVWLRRSGVELAIPLARRHLAIPLPVLRPLPPLLLHLLLNLLLLLAVLVLLLILMLQLMILLSGLWRGKGVEGSGALHRRAGR